MSKLRLSDPIFNQEKMREVILYILNKRTDVDEETLCNILYFIDFDYYEKYEEHLMGCKYEKESIIEKEVNQFCKEKYCNILDEAKKEFFFIKENILERFLAKYAIHNAKTFITRELMKYKKQEREKVYEDIMENYKEEIFLVLEDWDNEKN